MKLKAQQPLRKCFLKLPSFWREAKKDRVGVQKNHPGLPFWRHYELMGVHMFCDAGEDFLRPFRLDQKCVISREVARLQYVLC